MEELLKQAYESRLNRRRAIIERHKIQEQIQILEQQAAAVFQEIKNHDKDLNGQIEAIGQHLRLDTCAKSKHCLPPELRGLIYDCVLGAGAELKGWWCTSVTGSTVSRELMERWYKLHTFVFRGETSKLLTDFLKQDYKGK
ncbi:hypothetical protein EK21DRAFT_111042 [Setomelanomma holmii]|uniref:Uncharacterized protein n=1 Tax=Setomelanomma holmii TaxID=210430 RepID=A0A9P4HDQ2_9PLEO|nr:hypothetical protein EK21DRAFT_111042 [Setomelanomma holmii]